MRGNSITNIKTRCSKTLLGETLSTEESVLKSSIDFANVHGIDFFHKILEMIQLEEWMIF